MLNILYNISDIHIITICAALALFTALIIFIRTRHIMKNLNNMLDQAIAGKYNPEHINESLLSAVEFKLARHLSDTELSARNAAYEKDKIKTLISDISHQTKTPISNIMLYSELLAEQDLDKTSAGYAKALNAQAQKLNFLIISLIKMSRLETGILTLHPKSESIMLLLEKAYAQSAPNAISKGLDFDIVFSGKKSSLGSDDSKNKSNAYEMLRISANSPHSPCNDACCRNFLYNKKERNADIMAVFDAKWTLEAICNILDNAIKYTDKGSITIKPIAYEMFCRIDVKDTGSGIFEDEQAQIFARFYRSPQAADKEGLGIGLYLAREIISHEGGYIKLSSTPGKGSVFSVFLPLDSNSNLSKL